MLAAFLINKIGWGRHLSEEAGKMQQLLQATENEVLQCEAFANASSRQWGES